MDEKRGKSRLTRVAATGSPSIHDTRPIPKGTAGPPGRQTGTSEKPTQPVPTRRAPIFKQAAVVRGRSLHVRRDHSMNAEAVGSLRGGDVVTVLETWNDGRDTWARIGESQWAIMVFNGINYIELV